MFFFRCITCPRNKNHFDQFCSYKNLKRDYINISASKRSDKYPIRYPSSDYLMFNFPFFSFRCLYCQDTSRDGFNNQNFGLC